MKVNKVNFYKTLFIVLLLAQIYLPSFKTNIFLQLIVLVFYFYNEKPKLSFSFLNSLAPIIGVFFLGFIGLLFFANPLSFALKDVFHFIKPLQGILIGYFFFKTINNTVDFIKTIVLIGFISAIIHFLILLVFADLAAGSVNEIREYTRDNYLELIALFFLIFYKKFFLEELFSSKLKSKIFFLVLTFSCILYFSRTMIVVSILILLSIYGFTKITKKTLKVLLFVFISIFLFYGYLYSVKIERNKPGLEAFLYKIKIAPEELFKTKIDRENHKDLWDHWRGYEAKRAFALIKDKPLSFFSGTGYGSLVNLKFYAPLGNGKKGLKYISELHNGYPYVLYKTGIMGLFLYLMFLFKLYKKIYLYYSFETVFISAFGILYLFTTLTITGIYNTNDTTIFVLGALFYSFEKNKKTKTDD